MDKIYACIDLKSFYASVECVERGLDPMNTNLVVADSERTEKTICLAVSPSLKKYGIPGRARLFEVVQKVRNVNYDRRRNVRSKILGKSYNAYELDKNKYLEVDYIVAKPRMSYYMRYSTNIYNIYLKYIAPEDIFVYSIDEVFCDITGYLNYNNMTAKEFITMIIHDVYETTGITATAGIGTNMYLAKVAMDIVAKHTDADKFGVRIAKLDEMSYREKLWNHQPLTSFWRIGSGYAKKLNDNGMFTMGDVARCSINNENLLYKLFGVNAELLIDHAWGWENTTIKDVKSYKPQSNSMSSGQVLHDAYTSDKARLIVKEMVDLLSLELVSKCMVTDQLILTIGYDVENMNDINIMSKYDGEIVKDYYGRSVPKSAHGTINLEYKTSSTKIIIDNMLILFDKIINKNLLVRRINIVFNNVISSEYLSNVLSYKQLDLFTNYNEFDKDKEKEKIDLEEENKLQHVLIDIKNKYGKNSILKGMNIIDGATAKDRNNQIGGHRA